MSQLEPILDDLFKTFPAVVFERETFGKRHYTLITERCKEVLGFSQEELYADSFVLDNALCENHKYLFVEPHLDVQNKSENMLEFSVQPPDGKTRHLRSFWQPVYDDSGKLVKIRGICFDVTAEINARANLSDIKNTHEKLELLFGERTQALKKALHDLMQTEKQLALANEQLKAANRQLSYRANHDALTQLGNRAMLDSRLQAMTPNESLGILLMDLDRFKRVNDTLGHPAGDKLLVEVAHRIRGATRETDLPIRLGGDEFAILAFGKVSPEVLKSMGNRILNAFAQPFIVQGTPLNVSTSIGIAYGSASRVKPEYLMRFADTALYRAKNRGRNRMELIEDCSNTRLENKLDEEAHLRLALQQGEVKPWYQPIIDLNSQRVIGGEALARWEHPEKGVLNAAQFMPMLEEAGLLGSLADIIGTEAISYRQSLNQVPSAFKIHINISPTSLTDDNINLLLQEVNITQSPREGITIELTETSAIRDLDAATTLINKLTHTGIGVEIDDFGVGYSNLERLVQLPVTGIKIDRSFVAEVVYQNSSRALVAAMVELAKRLGVSVVAEGVETEEQRLALLELGVTLGQGFLWSPAVDGEAFQQLTQTVPWSIERPHTPSQQTVWHQG